jgi:hypothetical protein
MTFRHAAALALVGWYLMMPPSSSSWLGCSAHQLGLTNQVCFYIDTAAPMPKWSIQGSFGSARECAEAQLRASEAARKLAGQDPLRYYQTVEAVCIATDDPRLAK